MPQLSIVVPTFNEAGNVAELKNRVAAALAGVDWEILFVDDDSTDGTTAILRDLAQADPRVRCLWRIGRRGLASACMEGAMASSAPVVAVIDADLQHDERLLPQMYELIERENLDVVVGSRYVESGSAQGLSESRAVISRFATRLAQVVLKADLHDPMSGFFMIRHAALAACARAGVTGLGFKILLDLFSASPVPLRYRELPYQFRDRVAGASKLDSNVAWEYFIMLLDRFLGRAVPVRFIAFSLVGGFGILVHLAALALFFKGLGAAFLPAQVAATMIAMTSNFALNNVLTYRDLRLRGWRLLQGWFSFVLACSVGALANVGVAEFLYERDNFWVASAIAGTLVGAVWNYAVTAVYTWKARK